MRRPHSLFIALVLVASPVLVATTTTQASAAVNAPAPTITPSSVLTGQTVHITGDIGDAPATGRALDLQYKSGSSWKKVVSGKTDLDGLYDFSQKITASKTFRVSAAKASSLPAIVSDAAVTIAPTVETASISIARDSGNGDIADVTATLSPAVENRPVALQVQSGSKWNPVATLAEDATGQVSTAFDIAGVAPFTAKSYRLVAASVDGSTAFTSSTYKFTPGPKSLGTNVIRISVAGGVLPTSKSKEYTGSADIFVGGALTRTESIEKFGVRGSSTSGYDKKPYKLKFDDSFKLFGMPDKGKSYTMLASYLDQSFIRDKVGLDLGRELAPNLSWTPNSRFAEVFINGEYRGSYLITESVKIDDKRVNIGETTGMIMETDGSSVANSKLGFLSTHSIAFAFKDPDTYLTPPDVPEEGVTTAKLAAIKARTNAFEAKLYSSSTGWNDPTTGYPSFIDVDSAIDFYLVREFTKDNDSDFYRSNYFYWDPAGDNKFHFGPVWDFDRSAGNITDTDAAHKYQSSPQGWYIRGTGTSSGRKNYKTHWFVQMFRDPAFNDAVKARWLVIRDKFAAVSTTDTAADAAAIGVAADNDRARWASTAKRYTAHSTPGQTGYAGEISYVTKWYHDRYNWMDQQLASGNTDQLP